MPLMLHNLFVRPQARIAPIEPAGGGQTLRLQVDGMVCDI